MNAERLIAHTQDLISKGDALPARPSGQQYTIGPTRLEARPFAEWYAQALAYLRSSLPAGHTFIEQFVAVASPKKPNDPVIDNREAGVGVLSGFLADVRDGYLRELRALVAAEVFTDFLEMAEHLVEEGYAHAGASVAGAVLEDAMRRGLGTRGVKATGSLESMNQVAADQGIYSRITAQQVKVWIGVRNSAAHGNWDAIEANQVQAMVRDLPSFLAQHLGLG